MSPEIVRGQIEAVMEDLQPVALKIGMINDIQIVRVISDCIRKYTPQYIPVNTTNMSFSFGINFPLGTDPKLKNKKVYNPVPAAY